MSRTTAAEIQDNPCSKFLQWKTVKETIIIDGDEVEKLKGGTFSYYDKASEEKVPIKLPLKFAILNMDLVSFKGYDEKNKCGVYSNEVKDPEHVVTLKSKEGTLMSFKKSEYKLNKDKLKGFGAKYTGSVYIAVEVEGEWEIWNLQLSGGSLSGAPEDMSKMTAEEKEEGWFSFTKNNKAKLYSNFVNVDGFKAKKKGATKFTIPLYTVGEAISDEQALVLNDLDAKLNEYLDYYFKKPVTEVIEKKEVEEEEADY